MEDTHILSPQDAWPADTALQCRAHLACIQGPDIGAVIPIRPGVVVGRASGLQAGDVSRVHAHIQAATVKRSLGEVVDAGSLNGTTVIHHRVRQVLKGNQTNTSSNRHHEKQEHAQRCSLKKGDRVQIGSDVFQVRLRPLQLQWPRFVPARTARFWFLLPMLVMGGFVMWRMINVQFHIHRGVLFAVIIGLLSATLAVWATLLFRQKRRWASVDGAFLQLVVNALPRSVRIPVRGASSLAGHGSNAVEVWSGRASRQPGCEAAVTQTPKYSAPRARNFLWKSHHALHCERPAFVGQGSLHNARWWSMQIAARLGGALVRCHDQTPVLVGTAAVEIHIVCSAQCSHCARTTEIWPDSDWAPDSRSESAGAASPPYNSTSLSPEERPVGQAHGIGMGPHHLPLIHVAAAETLEQVPTWCDQIFTSQGLVSETWWNQIAQSRPEEHSDLPTHVLLADLLTDAYQEDTNLQEAGEKADGDTTLQVPIARNTHGIVTFDLVSDGPHALVAGTTGCGKSQALLSWLLALCLTYSPTKLRLVLMDFKGGATFDSLSGLPHVDTVLTDLDPALTHRALRGIKALLLHRERQLARLKLPDITAWQRASYEGNVEAAPPRIVVVVDEFRVLSESHPQALDTLIRLAAQGRSLGLHVVVATQRPAGSVTPAMRANIEARIALRCSDVADSVDIIGDPAASKLPRIPGRAILADYGQVQFAWAPDVAHWVKRIQKRWTWSGPPLWTPPLPRQVTWTDLLHFQVPSTLVSSASGSTPTSAIPLGIQDGIDEGHHSLFCFDPGHISIQTTRARMPVASKASLSIASQIAVSQQTPLHVIGDDLPKEIAADSLVSPSDAEAVSLLLEQMTSHGPAVLAIQDWGKMMRHLENGIGAGNAQALWSSLVEQSSHMVNVIAATTIGSRTTDWAHLRLVHCLDSEQAIRAGLKSTAVCEPIDGRFIAIQSQASATVQVPLIPVPLPASSARQKELSHWHVMASDSFQKKQPTRVQTRKGINDQITLLAGSDWHVLPVQPDQRWLVISDQPQPWIDAIDRAYLSSGMARPKRIDVAYLFNKPPEGSSCAHPSNDYGGKSATHGVSIPRNQFQGACVATLGLRQWSSANQLSECTILLAPVLSPIVRALLPWGIPAFVHAQRPLPNRGLLVQGLSVERAALAHT